MFQHLREQSELSSAHPPEFGMTVGRNRDMIRSERVKLTGTSAAEYEEAESICTKRRTKQVQERLVDNKPTELVMQQGWNKLDEDI